MQNEHEREESASDLINPLINEPIQLPATDKIFYEAYRNCQLINKLLCLSALIITIITPFYIFSLQFSRLTLYLVCLMSISFFRLFYYNSVRLILSSIRVYYLIAQRTQHLIYVNTSDLSAEMVNKQPRCVQYYDMRDPTDPDVDRKLRALHYQIKTIILNSSITVLFMNKLQFFLYQVVHMVGITFLLFYDFGDSSVKTLLVWVILTGTYQYIEFYLLLVFLSIVLPYYFLKNIYNYLVIKYRNYRLEKSLKSERFSDKNIVGDKECKICLMPYEPNDSVIVLRCNQMHNFHSSCLREWAKHSVTCPLCRADLSAL